MLHGGEGDEGLAPCSAAARVFVLDRHGHPLMPCRPARARKLLASGRAVVAHHTPLVIRLKDREAEQSAVDGAEIGIDPGSEGTGIALFTVTEEGMRRGLVPIQVDHRGTQIHGQMKVRSDYRRGRRSRKLRYRAPRFSNRHPASCNACGRNAQHKKRYCRPCAATRNFTDNGYRKANLPPSVQHRVGSVMSMVEKLRRWAPITPVHMELVRFDMQQMQNPEISGVEYQQGTLFGYEVREYLFAKWHHTCTYCGASGVGKGSVPLNIDHIHPRSKGGSDRVSNLALACIPCNQAKGNRPVEEFLAHDPEGLRKVLAQAKALLLGDEHLCLPRLVAELAEGLRRLEEGFERLQAAQERTEATLPRFMASTEARLSGIESGVSVLESDVSVLESDVSVLKSDVAELKGSDLERRVSDNPSRYLHGHVERARVLRGDALDTFLGSLARKDPLDPAEARRLRSTDLVVAGYRAGSNERITVVVEVSSTIHVDDVVRAAEPAEILARRSVCSTALAAGGTSGRQTLPRRRPPVASSCCRSPE
ncbi:MAG: RNA-guided endonuclease IscB [Acidimicrobiales bacterium]